MPLAPRPGTVTTPTGTTGQYTYDGMGRRVALRVNGEIQRRYLYAGSMFPRARLDGAGDVLERYIYAAATHVPELIVRRDGQRLRLITDSLGSVRAVVDSGTGNVVQRLAYDAYGRVTQDTAPGTQPFGFKGALSDPIAQGAGLVWMGVRAYVPSLARFATPDPEDINAAWNEHDAFAGDPINLIDADGRWPSRNEIVDTVAGVGDGILKTFCAWQCDPGAEAREAFGIDDKVDMCSDAYKGGEVAGQMAVPIPGPGKLKALDEAAGGVYSLLDEAGNVVRTGRSKNLARREAEHARDPALGQYRFRAESRTDDYATQRGLEQKLHDEYLPPLNKIRPIGSGNPRRDEYLDAARGLGGG